MFRSFVLWILLFFAICSFCGKEFQALGRYTWRCKRRLDNNDSGPSGSINIPFIETENESASVINERIVKCSCGKECKGMKGLKMHQRRCRVISGFQSDDTFEQVSEETLDNEIILADISLNEYFELKPGVCLPRSNEEWTVANDYFKYFFTINPMDLSSIDQSIQSMNQAIYNYFRDTCGFVEEVNEELAAKYQDHATKELKKELQLLKRNGAPVIEIKYVSRVLRQRLNSSASTVVKNISNHDNFISKSFWGYVKRVLRTSSTLLPSFSKDQCSQYFFKMFSSLSPCKNFSIPSWIPTLREPDHPFPLEPPSYEKITSVIRRMKSSATPCPRDKISIIVFKRCPYLRSLITNIIHNIWLSGKVPLEWKKACTILIHKKGSNDDPANFRPITLEPVPLKIFTSCLRDSLFNFLKVNGLIEHEIQKGFTSNISGTLEHTAMMAQVINKARIKQRSLVITLLDLKNAFGEVHHNLIPTILSYHHIPDNIQLLISSLYTDFNTSIITSHYNTPAIPVRRGVLQGDCLSPLLFNLCFNTFIQYIKAEKYKQLGFSPHDQNDRMFQPVHWFQFADDAAVITSNEKENQLLLNCFTRWCQWANMIIRVDKCITFGIKKFSSRSLQYQPKLFINNESIPPVSNGNSFKYLGRHFDFEMTNQEHKSDLLSSLSNMLKQIDSQPLHAKNKLLLYHNFVLSKISWNLTVADLSKTWVVENLDSLVSKYIRQWLDLPISATLSSIILSKNQFGLSLTLPSSKFLQCQTVLRNALKSSPNDNIRSLWKNTSSGTNIQYDIYRNTKEALKAVQHEHKDRLQNILTSQGSLLSHLFNQNLPQINKLWSKVQSSMPQNIFNFTIRYLKFKQLGFSPHSQPDCMFTPEHWFQFEDDAAVITNGEKENQLLLNCFTRWCQWSNMIIRVDKCTTFGIKKFSKCSLQYQPKIFINNEIVPPVITGESFKYLGRHFDFNMSNQEHMSKLSSIFTELLTQIDSLPLHPKNKLLLYNSYLLSQVSWHLTVPIYQQPGSSKTLIIKFLHLSAVCSIYP